MYMISKWWLTVNEYFKWLQKVWLAYFNYQMPDYQFIIHTPGKLQKIFKIHFLSFLWETIQC
jgi:hypothetical protein